MPQDEPEGWREGLAQWGPAILAVIFIRLFLFEPFRIPSGSMVPTLLIGDHVLVTKFSYGVWMPFKSIGVPFSSFGLDDIGMNFKNFELLNTGDPARGDVIVFHYPQDEDVTYIKRVIGLPGDTIRVQDNTVVLNGELMTTDELGEFSDVDGNCKDRRARFYRENLKSGEDVVEHGILTNRGYGGPLANRAEIKVPPDSVFVMGDNRDHSEDSRRWGLVRYDQIKGKAHLVWLSWDGCSTATPIGGVRIDRMFRSLYRSDDLADQAAPGAATP
jgi:signal peptidase I